MGTTGQARRLATHKQSPALCISQLRSCRHSGQAPFLSTPQSTIDAFMWLASYRDVSELREWLRHHPKDAAFLLTLLKGKVDAKRADIDDLEREFVPHIVSPPPDNAPPPDAYPESANGEPDVGPISPAKTQALKLTYFDDCGAYAQKRSILKGIIARGETSAWIAPPGQANRHCYRKFRVHCAAQTTGGAIERKIACGVVVLALERADLFKRRLRVYQQRDGLNGLPIAVADAVIDLLNPACVETIVATVRAAEQQFGLCRRPDRFGHLRQGHRGQRWGRGQGAGSEPGGCQSPQRTRAGSDVHIALVGHTGKDETPRCPGQQRPPRRRRRHGADQRRYHQDRPGHQGQRSARAHDRGIQARGLSSSAATKTATRSPPR